MNVLAIDVGTSSTKTAILDEQCNIITASSAGYDFHYHSDNRVELDAEEIISAIVKSIQALTFSLAGIDLIVFDTFSPSLTFMNDDGDVLCPVITHLDRRSKKQTQNILTTIGKDRFQAITGIQPFTGGASVTSLLWMLENNPELIGQCTKIGHLPTLLYKRFTGLWATDPVNASMTGLYETITQSGWSKELCDDLGIPMNLLPEIKPVGIIEKGLCREFALRAGLRAGIPVALGSNDAAVAHIGAGNTSSGCVMNTAGSSDIISVLSDIPRFDDRYYLRNACIPGLWQIFAITAGGFALDWCREQFYRDMTPTAFYEDELRQAVALCGEDMPVQFEPYLAGDRQSLTLKWATFSGLTLNTSRRDMLAALLMGMQRPLKEVMSLCEAFLEMKDTIKATGGMLSKPMVALKENVFSGYHFEKYDDCPLLGSAIIGLQESRHL